jgi:signal transduction histidine kinase
MLTVLLQTKDSLEKYIDIAPSVYNPIFISIIIFLIIFAFIYISFRHVYNPMLRRHKKEQEQYEINTAKLLAQFSELDPNPIIRINSRGMVVSMNKSATEIFGLKVNDSKINSLLDNIDFDIKDSIKSDKQIIISKQIGDKFYDINFHGVSFLKMAQLYFWDVTLKKEYDEQMNHYQRLLKNTSAYLQKTQEDERNRMSEVLHHSVGQNLLLIKLNINKYKNFIPLGLDESEYNRTIDILENTINRVRDVAYNLKPLNLDELGLITIIKSMCRNVSKESGLKYRLEIPEQTDKLSKEQEICIYRILQESLNNIIRYSKATEFIVSLLVEEYLVTLSVSDNGIGFKPKKLLNDKYISDGMGIMNMQENAERFKGTFQIDSSLNQGTNIIVTLPLDNKDDTKPEYKNISR